MRAKIFLLCIAIIGLTFCVPSKAFSENDDRMNLISKELDCVSAHEQQGTVDWNDVCYSSSNSRERTIAKAMDQMIQEHQNMSEEMLANNSEDEKHNGPRTIDDVYQDQQASNNDDDTFTDQPNEQVTTENIENNTDEQEPSYDGQDQSQYFSVDESVPESNDETADQVNSRKHEFDLGREDYYYRYEEDIPIYIRGVMHGFYANYTYRPEEESPLNNEVVSMYKFEGSYTRGDLDYEGSGMDNDRTNKTYEIRGLLGKDYVLDDHSRVTPYVGLGYRYLIDRGGGRLTDANFYGYNRESNYYYLPIGCFVDIPAPHDWNIGLNFEYDFFLQGVQKSRLSDGDQFNGLGNDDIRNHQSKGFGLRGSVKFLKKLPGLDFYVEPFIRYWNIDRSSLQSARVDGTFSSTWNEPKNNTTEIGSKIGLQF